MLKAKPTRNHKSIFIAPIESTVQPLEIPLTTGGDAFWLDTRTIAHAVDEGEGQDKVKVLYALSVKYETQGTPGTLSIPGSPVPIGKFPTSTAANFVVNSKEGLLIFSDNVFADGDLKAVKKNDEKMGEPWGQRVRLRRHLRAAVGHLGRTEKKFVVHGFVDEGSG